MASTIRSMARAVTLVSFSSDSKFVSLKLAPSFPAWQYWQRTFRLKEKPRITPSSSSREIVFGKNCRFLNWGCVWAGADVWAVAPIAVRISARVILIAAAIPNPRNILSPGEEMRMSDCMGFPPGSWTGQLTDGERGSRLAETPARSPYFADVSPAAEPAFTSAGAGFFTHRSNQRTIS